MRGNPAGRCFVLRDLFKMRFFILITIVLLNIYASDARSVYCNDFEKSDWEYLLSKQQIYSMLG